ncbi:hypothetical protein A3758_10525 [Oleiphilus sp. HI0118]|nr:hypothetical protein A3758_10525 [Oleiphilus sp. HI0118]
MLSRSRTHQSAALASLILLISVLLSACGVPGSGGSGPDFDNPDRDSGDPELNKIDVPVTVEATSRMMQQAAGSENIITADNINCSAISVVQLGFDFVEGRLTDIPNYTAKARADSLKPNAPGCKLEFIENFEPRIDAVIRVEYPNQEVLYAPLRRAESDDQSIVVSFGSHLAVERLFDQLNDSIDLAKHLPCVNNTDCETQHRAKARLLSFIAETARVYEYSNDVQSSQTAEEALNLLRSKSDLITHIDTAVKEIVRSESPIAKGTVRDSYDTEENSDILNGGLQSRLRPTDTYNSVFFSMGFIQDASTALDNKLVISSSHIGLDESDEVLPRLIHNAYYLDYRYDDVLPDVPFEMSTLRFQSALRPFVEVDPSRPENRYAFITNPEQDNGTLVNGTHLSSQGFFLNDRAIAQTITNTPDSQPAGIYGYDYNPVYYKLYRINEYEPDTTLNSLITPQEPDYGLSPTWLAGTGYGLINVFNLNQTGSDPDTYERDGIAESQRYFSWEVHGLQVSEDFGEDDISGEYDVLEFSIDIDEDNANNETILIRAESSVWTANSGSFSTTQPIGDTHYRTWELVRNENNVVTSRLDQTNPNLESPSFTLYEVDSVDDDDNPIRIPNGLIAFGQGTRSKVPLGHVSDNGDHLAFAIDTGDNRRAKRGLILASRQRSDNIQLTTGAPLEFTISGHYFFMDNDAHILTSLDESRLSLSVSNGAQDCDAELSLQSVRVEHSLTTDPQGQILDPINTPLTNYQSSGCTLNGGQVELQFTVEGTPLTLRGFAMNEDGALGLTVKQINLLWLQDNALGMVFAQLDQGLSAEFDN